MHTHAAPPNMSATPHLSRQREWQLTRLAEGFCQECGRGKRAVRVTPFGFITATLCDGCRDRQNAARRARKLQRAKETA